MTRWTVALLVALGAAAGFFVGVELQKGQTDGTTSGLPAGVSLPAGFSLPETASGAGAGSGGRTGGGDSAGAGGATAAGVTFGEIKLVDGDNIYVTDAQGNTVKVSTAGSEITANKPGTIADLKPGETVVVRGEADKEGTIAATSISSGVSGGLGAIPGAGG